MVFNFGKGWVALWSATDAISTLVRDCGGDDTFFLDDAGFDHEDIRETRIVIGDIVTFDDGPGDYPGSREVGLRLDNVRTATAQEWADFVAGDCPWDIFNAPVPNPSTATAG